MIFSFNQCYFSTVNYAGIIWISFLFILSLGLIIAGQHTKNAITGFIGSMILIFFSIYLYVCYEILGFAFSLLGLWFAWYFLAKGWKGEL